MGEIHTGSESGIKMSIFNLKEYNRGSLAPLLDFKRFRTYFLGIPSFSEPVTDRLG